MATASSRRPSGVRFSASAGELGVSLGFGSARKLAISEVKERPANSSITSVLWTVHELRGDAVEGSLKPKNPPFIDCADELSGDLNMFERSVAAAPGRGLGDGVAVVVVDGDFSTMLPGRLRGDESERACLTAAVQVSGDARTDRRLGEGSLLRCGLVAVVVMSSSGSSEGRGGRRWFGGTKSKSKSGMSTLSNAPSLRGVVAAVVVLLLPFQDPPRPHVKLGELGRVEGGASPTQGWPHPCCVCGTM